MSFDIESCTDSEKLRSFRQNALRLDRKDLADRAFRQLCKVAGMDMNTALESDFYVVLSAYEELLTEKNGRTTRASRTRQKLSKTSVKKCIEDWALKDGETDAFKLLIERQMGELTAEYLVLKHSSEFDDAIVSSARKRLDKYGITYE